MGKEVNFGKLLHGGDYNPEQWLDYPDGRKACFEIRKVPRISRKPESTRFRLACFPGHF